MNSAIKGKRGFRKGISGNPNGKPKGTLCGVTKLRDLFKPHAPAIMAILIEKALAGDHDSIKLCLERMIPRIRYDLMDIEVPKKITNDSILGMSEHCIRQLASGEITLDSAQAFMQVLESQVKIFQSKELQVQFDEIKAKMDAKA